MSHEQIAIGLGISRTTLDKHFEAELSSGAYAKRMEVLVSLHQAAKKGIPSAAKAYLAAEPGLAAPPAPAAEPKPTQPLGKKEKAQADAVTAANGTSWDALLPSSTRVQ